MLNLSEFIRSEQSKGRSRKDISQEINECDAAGDTFLHEAVGRREGKALLSVLGNEHARPFVDFGKKNNGGKTALDLISEMKASPSIVLTAHWAPQIQSQIEAELKNIAEYATCRMCHQHTYNKQKKFCQVCRDAAAGQKAKARDAAARHQPTTQADASSSATSIPSPPAAG